MTDNQLELIIKALHELKESGVSLFDICIQQVDALDARIVSAHGHLLMAQDLIEELELSR